MPSNTQIKIRHGLILQAVLAQALRNAGYSFAETPNYDADSEVPDFLIPDAENPEFMLEVHQTEARNHFQMKTLRSVTAVAESKAFFGADVVSVNVLFGDPDSELPAANLRAMCGIFDVNLVLRRDANAAGRTAIATMEAAALELAGDTDVTTTDAARRLVAVHGAAVREFERLLTNALEQGEMKESLRPMWVAEAARRAALAEPPAPGAPTYYKKNMVRSLFFQDEHFAAMAADPTPNTWDQAIVRQVVATGIGTVTEEIDGDHLDVDAEFLAFLRDPDAPRLRGLCKEVLDATPSMHWFFEDIRDESRRRRMGQTIRANAHAETLEDLLKANFRGETLNGIVHERNWVVDASRSAIGASQNDLSRLIYNELSNVAGFLYPISHIGPNTAQFQALRDEEKIAYAHDVALALELFQERTAVDLKTLSENEISAALLELRFVGAMRLRRLDVLMVAAASVAGAIGLALEPVRLDSVMGDFAEQRSVSRFELFEFIGDGNRRAYANFVSAEGNPRDKAKEWGARRLATLYRAPGGIVNPLDSTSAIFVIDGTWAQSDVTRLYRCGWTHIVRLGQLDATLREVFGLNAATSTRPRRRPIRLDAADLSDLPMAAED
jgi:hypothetical protein